MSNTNDYTKAVAAFLLPERAAFSLVEMLMALLVASLLLAALAPVVTKKFNENVSIFGAGGGGGRAPAMFKCWDYDSPELQLADDGSGYKVLPDDFPVEDAWIANFIIASGGGGGAGATNSATVSDSYTEPLDNKNGIKIEFNMDEFEIETMTGGGGGAGGGAAEYSGAICTGSPSEAKCECMGTFFDSKNNVCISNNQGIADFNGAKTKCTALNTSVGGTWTPPSYGQLGNWSQNPDGTGTIYSKVGVTSGQSVWSKDTGSYCASTGTVTRYACKYRFCGGCGTSGNVPQMKKWYICAGNNNSSYPTCNCPPTCTETVTNGVNYTGAETASSCVANSDYYGYKRCNSCGPYQTTACTSSPTTYRYYTLSGTSWNASSDNSSSTSSSTSRQVYCVYNGTENINGEKFYSLSGGGGSSSPSITDDSFDINAKKRLKDAIKNNIGGYIVLDVGNGGQGGSGAPSKGGKALNGGDGGESCIVIQDSGHHPKFKLCVKGGKGGGGADASIANASSNGYGRKGEKVSKENSCYTYDYTVSDNNRIDFNCTNDGKEAGNGGASTNNPTTGGLGGASILNDSQVSNSGKDGVTPNSTSNPGAGGGGGTAVKSGSGSSATFGFGAGGDGAKGYIKLNFKRKFEAAGGGGGGAGYVAHIRNISVGKSATCKIKVGFGGIGGNGAGSSTPAIKGGDGGDSSISCSNAANITYRIIGGKGGEVGTSASVGSGSSSVGGIGGEAGGYDDVGNIFTRLFSQGNFTGYKGLEGKQGGSGEASNYKEGVRSAGGRGGTSGTGEKGKCGGLYNEANVCTSVTVDENNNISEPSQDMLNGLGFGSGEINPPTKDSIVEATPKFGKAGAGGGGGAWYIGKDPGKGGDGLGGYVCIYWDKLE
ncbi:MAG: hypothetical protein OSJ27_01280 [Candidatus Gastranaerophilales bacterium]|nr:hypothetical protein [Candidatus Gastranaerophilales bacterium]